MYDSDAADSEPEVAELDVWDLAESGRGLFTISVTASWWDWCGGPLGRTITAVFYDRPALHPL
jgi:hypothetical protein